jgi:hypothetical protein
VRFQDAARDARAVVYAGIQADPLVARAAALLADATLPQRLHARAIMNGETASADAWRRMLPALFAREAGTDEGKVARSEAILEVSLAVARRGEQVRSQYRGAIIEALTAGLLARRLPLDLIRKERRVLFDGVTADIHPYDVTAELADRAEVYDCKWGARGINAEVLLQLASAHEHAADEGFRLTTALVVFDARLSCQVRLARQPQMPGVSLITIETLDALAGVRPAAPA